jgi:hypothetical protein
LYGLIKTFEDLWLAATFENGQGDYESGNLYQGEFLSSDLRYEGTNISRCDYGQYNIKAESSKKKISSYKYLQEFAEFINESTTETIDVEEWEKRLDVEGYLRS